MKAMLPLPPWLLLSLSLLCPVVGTTGPITYRELTEITQPPAVEPHYYGVAPAQFGELLVPVGSGPFPVVVLLHGGCWFAEYGYTHIRPLAAAIMDLGFVTWTLEYRRVGEVGGAWPGTFLDVADGMDHLRQLAARYPLDLDRVIAVGHSAGGQLALWLGNRDELPADSELFRAQPLLPSAIIGLAAAADMALLAQGGECEQAALKVLQDMPAQAPRRYREASPHLRVPVAVPQVLINGEQDAVWSPIADSYYEAAVAMGAAVRRVVVPGAGHFDLVAPQAPVWPHLRAALLQLSKVSTQASDE